VTNRMPTPPDARTVIVGVDTHKHDHTLLRRYPVWKFGDDNYLCVDPAFIQEKLSSGVYWTVMNGLDADNAERFARLWGRLFEHYLWTLLESIYPANQVWRSPRYTDNRDEAFDAMVDCGDKLIVCQAKASATRRNPTSAGTQRGLEPPPDVSRELGEAVRCFSKIGSSSLDGSSINAISVRRPPHRGPAPGRRLVSRSGRD